MAEGTEAGPVTAREAARTTNGAGYTRQPEPSGAEAGPVTALTAEEERYLRDWGHVGKHRCAGYFSEGGPSCIVRRLLATLDEARQQRDAELRAAVEVLPWQSLGHGRYVWKAAVLRLLSDHARADTPSREGGEG